MHKIMIAITGAGLLALTGCASNMPPKSEVAQAPVKAEIAPKAQLTDEAKQALAKAEADIKAAQTQKALWVPAQNALKQAKVAAEANDSATVIKQANMASELAQLGIAQTKYPVTTISK